MEAMQTESEIVNRVATSGLITLDLADYYPSGERVQYDLKENLFQGLILREKDFRQFLKEHDWSSYQGKNVAVMCSEDVILPVWAYMLLTIHLEPYANMVVFGDLKSLEQSLFQQALAKINVAEFKNAKVVIKGCGDLPIPEYAYMEITRLLRPVVQTMMYGEPCSTVPLYKRPKNMG